MPDFAPDMLLPDKPLEHPKGDHLGYASFAERIAKCVSKRIPVHGLVTAIHGPWGSGKSTVLNFVEYYLEALPQAERPIIVRFNPWWFSGRQDIVLQFFGQLRRALSGLRVKARKVARLIADLTGALSPLAGPYAPYGAAGAQATRVLLRDQTDAHKLKAKIEKALISSDQSVVFIIDDIDRLAKEEIRELFTAIRAIADFPKVCYLLAFDREVVAKALNDMQDSNGEEYLAKIVQVPVSLPPSPRTALDGLLEEKLFPLFKATARELLDEERFRYFYSHGLRYFINTPRDIMRLVNSVMLFYQKVQDEVKCPDYVALNALNVFCPSVYEVIENNKEMFAFLPEDDLKPGIRMDELKRFHRTWLGRVDERDGKRVARLISVMFPKLGAIMEGQAMTGSRPSSSLPNLEISSPVGFDLYFRNQLPSGGISHTSIMANLALADDPEAFGRRLLDMSKKELAGGVSLAIEFLARLEDYTEEIIPREHIPSILMAIFDVGDQLWCNDKHQRQTDPLGCHTYMMQVVYQLARRLSKPGRFKAYRDAFSKGRALATIARTARALAGQHGRSRAGKTISEDARDLTPEHQDEIDEIVLNRVRMAAGDGSLLDPTSPSPLYFWEEIGGPEQPRDWVAGFVKSDKSLVKFLETFLGYSWGLDGERKEPHVPLDSLSRFIDPAHIISRARKLVGADWPTETQKDALNQFVREYDEQAKSGEDPDSPDESQDE